MARVDPAAVGAAFVVSLATRRLDLRSALGSYAVGRHLPEHPFRQGMAGCRVCGLYERDTPISVTELDHERRTWGGVRHEDPRYVAFDLTEFLSTPQPVPGERDVALCRSVLAALRALPPATTAAKAGPALRMVPGNKHERDVLLEILGYCGILQTDAHRGFADGFVEHDDRAQRNTDLAYPIRWWKAGDGVNDTNVARFLAVA
ncbi:hypothetical protein [Dactylosporangium cerinum]